MHREKKPTPLRDHNRAELARKLEQVQAQSSTIVPRGGFFSPFHTLHI